MIARFYFLNSFFQAFYLHIVAWLLFEVYPVFIFSNGITLQIRTLTERNNIITCYEV